VIRRNEEDEVRDKRKLNAALRTRSIPWH